MKPRIVCAATRNPDGAVICSPRHFDHLCVKQMRAVPKGEDGWWISEQGFVDQFCMFYTRTEAWHVAIDNDQVIRRCGGDTTDGGTLYSENLY